MEIATRRRVRKRKSLLRFFFRMSLLAGICASIGLLAVFAYAYTLGPPPMESSQSTVVYDVNENIINEHHQGRQRNWISIEEVSPHVLDAFVAIEDRKFYEHHGFDYTRIGAAVLNNMQTMSRSQGASTITQQYARNLFLNHDKTWDRKIREALYALRLEWHVSKEDILEGYINTINFGHGAFGIERAAQMYFDVSASELNAAQSALLAGLPRGPSHYSPYAHPERAKERQELILHVMVEQGFLTTTEYEEAMDFLLTYETSSEEEETIAPYFQDTVERELIERYEVDPAIVEAGGLSIYTTLDADMQAAAEQQVEAALPAADPLQSAVVSMDPRNGDVKAMVGGRDYVESPFNRAVDAKRSPGSTFKPFLYYAALMNGFTPATLLKSEPTSFEHPDGDKSYEPGNFADVYANDFITLAQAIAYSDNIYAVKTHVLQEAEALIASAQAAGIESDLAPNLSLALGTSEVTLLELTNAYSPFANRGHHVEPRMIARVEDHDGNVILETEPEVNEVFDPAAAYIMTDMMRLMFNSNLNDYTSVTGQSITHLLSRPAAGKSGSTASDSWMIGYTPDLVTGVWIGYDENQAFDHSEHGQLAKRIWVKTLEDSLENKLKQDFQSPDGIEEVDIDLESGLLADDACGPSYTVAFLEDTAPQESCLDTLEEEDAEEDAEKEQEEKESEKLMERLKRWFQEE